MTAAVGLSLVSIGVGAIAPAVLLLGLVASAASLAARRLTLDVALAAGAGALLGTAILTGLAAGYLGVDLLTSPALLSGGYLLAATAVLVVSIVRPPQFSVGSRTSTPHRLAFALPWLPVAGGVAQVLVPGLTKSWAFWGTDIARQMTTLSQVQTDGFLDYRTASTYPRGLHMLAAMVSVPDAPLDAPTRLLGYDAVLVSALTWFALALMLLTACSVAVRVVERRGYLPVVGLLAAVLLVGGGLLTNTFLLSFLYAGAAASLVAVAACNGLVLYLLHDGRGFADRLAALTLACAGATLLVAHLWQALVLGPVLAWAVLAVPQLPGLPGLLRSQRRRRRLVAAGLVSAVCAAAAADPVLRVQQAAGLSYAAVPGELAGPPWRLLIAGGVALAVLLGTAARREPWLRGLTAIAIGLALSAYLLLRGTGRPTDLGQYYPMKAAWLLALVLAPALAAVAAGLAARVSSMVWQTLGRRRRPAFVLRATAVALVCGPGLALWTGYLVGIDSSTYVSLRRATPAPAGDGSDTLELSAVRYDVALRFGRDRGRAYVPWDIATAPFAPNGSMTTSLLLTFLTGQPEMPTGHVDVCTVLAEVAGSGGGPAIVLTQYPTSQVEDAMAEAGCAGRARVIHVPTAGYRD